MNHELLNLAEACLFDPDIHNKLEATRQAGNYLQQGGAVPVFSADTPAARPIDQARFPMTPQWVEARQLPRRGIGTAAGRIALLHAIAHIEFIAIHLAWDIVYRFRDMPAEFYRDWLEVAVDEARHFQLIESRLGELGASYGEMPVHGGLWDMATATRHDIIARLAMVPRYLEARGLDVTPGMIDGLEKQQDQSSADLLKIILNEEIDHVRKGDYWFRQCCAHQGLDAESHYLGLLEKYLNGRPRGPFNHRLRLLAGFSDREIQTLQQTSQK